MSLLHDRIRPTSTTPLAEDTVDALVGKTQPLPSSSEEREMLVPGPTVREFLDLAEIRAGDPNLLTGHEHLDRQVRWVHVSELVDVGPLLKGGEIILTTGVALPDSPTQLSEYVRGLADADVRGVVIELGRRYQQLPAALVKACLTHGVPLIELRREIPFVAVSQAVATMIIDSQMSELIRIDRANEAFSRLNAMGASVSDVVAVTSELSDTSVVLENLAHQALAYEARGMAYDRLLLDWEFHSRGLGEGIHEGQFGRDHWLVANVGNSGDTWGRLILVSRTPVTRTQTVIINRAAMALVVSKLTHYDEGWSARHAHQALINDIVSHSYTNPADIYARSQAMGVSLFRNTITPIVVKMPDGNNVSRAQRTELDSQSYKIVMASLKSLHLSALVAARDPGETSVLLSNKESAQPAEVVARLLEEIRGRLIKEGIDNGVAFGVGVTARDLTGIRPGLAEAIEVAGALTASPHGERYHELASIQLGRLLYSLRDNGRVQDFIEGEIGPLLQHDHINGSDLVSVLRVFLACGRNKSLAADCYHISRPAFYHRLSLVELVLKASLDSVERCVSLHVAIMGFDLAQDGRTALVTE